MDAQGHLFHCHTSPGYEGRGCGELVIMAQGVEAQALLAVWSEFMTKLSLETERQRLAMLEGFSEGKRPESSP